MSLGFINYNYGANETPYRTIVMRPFISQLLYPDALNSTCHMVSAQ